MEIRTGKGPGRRRGAVRAAGRLVIFVLLILALSGTAAAGEASFGFHLLDVGEGLGVLVESEGHYLLYDGGGRDASAYVVSYLKEQGAEQIDLLITSHYDEDHVAAQIGVMRALGAGELWRPSYEADTGIWEAYCTAVRQTGTPAREPQPGETFTLGEAKVELIGPLLTAPEKENDRSLCVLITCGELKFLLCGDTETAGEEALLAGGAPLDADFYVVNHHGSAGSTTQAFLDAVSPSYAMLSCGEGNEWGHPAKSAMRRLKKSGSHLFRTDRQGTVTVWYDGTWFWFSEDPADDFDAGTFAIAEGITKQEDGTFLAGEGEEAQTVTYICNMRTGVFHRPDCAAAAKISGRNRILSQEDRETLLAQGYAPCGYCRP